MRTLILAVAALFMLGCSNQQPTPVPRRTAYPRIAVYEQKYSEETTLPVRFATNANGVTETETKADGTIWVTVAYPSYEAKIYATFTPANTSDVARIVANRMERISLNINDRTAQKHSSTSENGYFWQIIESTSLCTTPIQFIAFNENMPKWVVSGSVFVDNISPSTSADSISPVIHALSEDVIKFLNSVQDK